MYDPDFQPIINIEPNHSLERRKIAKEEWKQIRNKNQVEIISDLLKRCGPFEITQNLIARISMAAAVKAADSYNPDCNHFERYEERMAILIADIENAKKS